MPNGQGLLGNASSSQSGVIIKNPVNEELYYIIAGFFWAYELLFSRALKQFAQFGAYGGKGHYTTSNWNLTEPITYDSDDNSPQPSS